MNPFGATSKTSQLMESLRPKIKLRAVFKNKATENTQSFRTQDPLTSAHVTPSASIDHGNGIYPMITGGTKRKRVHKAGPRRLEHKNMFTPGMASSVPAIHVEEENISGYDDNEDKVEVEEEVRMRDGMQFMLPSESADLNPEEPRNAEPVQYRQGSLRVKVKPLKFQKISCILPEKQEDGDNDKNHFISAFSALQNQNPAVGFSREFQNLASTRCELHTTKSEWPVATPSSPQLKPTRSLDRSNTPGQMSERSSSPNQSQAGKSLRKSENQKRKNIQKTEGPLHKRQCVAAGKRGSHLSQSNEKELEAALMIVKKIMKMEAAEPFNTPVDPVSLGIPDYFDVIDTPMDLGTLCHMLERGQKYKNSQDVFQDVQLIWNNCYKYNHKGHPILDLMKRVKKNFVKYWSAAGLYYEPPHRKSGLPFSGKGDAPSNLEDDVLKESDMQHNSSNNSDGNLEDSQTEKMKIGLYGQPSNESIFKSKAKQSGSIEQPIGGSKANGQNLYSDHLKALEVQHSSEESDVKMDTWQASQVDAMIKNKGIKFVFKKFKHECEPQDKTVIGISDTAECISNGTDEESGPKASDCERSFAEQTPQKDLGSKNRTHRRHGSHRHKPDCLCAVCVVTRRKHAREGKSQPAKIQSRRSDVNIAETMDEEAGEMLEKPHGNFLETHVNVHPVKDELALEIEEAQRPQEMKGDTCRLHTRWQHGKEDGESQRKEEKGTYMQHEVEAEQQREKHGRMQNGDSEKESSGKCYSEDFELPLQNTRPSILEMCKVLFTSSHYSAWNQAHSLTYNPSVGLSENPIMAAISTFME